MALAPGGALEAAIEAREEGLVRFIGVTGHGLSVPAMHARSLERFAVRLGAAALQLRQHARPALRRRLRGARAHVRGARRRGPDDQGDRRAAVGRARPDRRDLVRAAARARPTSISPCTGCSAGPGVFLNTAGDVEILLPLVSTRPSASRIAHRTSRWASSPSASSRCSSKRRAAPGGRGCRGCARAQDPRPRPRLAASPRPARRGRACRRAARPAGGPGRPRAVRCDGAGS